MKRWLGGLLLCLVSLGALAAESEISLLDNRFRVDPTMTQAGFIIYREKPSQPVVLVRPDGVKYYAWRHPENVSWYQEPDIDIILVENPMPGPWQAFGKITPENKIKVLSNLSVQLDYLPESLYAGETVKFTARLMQGKNLLKDRDFLHRVKLNVTFTQYLENEEEVKEVHRPQPVSLGDFNDDGTLLDEKPGDGVFTVAIPVDVKPGKYRVRVATGNGVFFRAVEKQVLVYPNPLMVTFNQSFNAEKAHQLVVQSDEVSIEAGSLAAQVEITNPEGEKQAFQGVAGEGKTDVIVNLNKASEPGRFSWSGWVYATDKLEGRGLMFTLPEHSFAQTDFSEVEKAEAERLAKEAERKRLEEEKRIEEEKAAARQQAIIMIVAGNVVILLLFFGVMFFLRWRKKKKAAAEEEENNLAVPPPDDEKKD